jgi:hypothetical protein
VAFGDLLPLDDVILRNFIAGLGIDLTIPDQWKIIFSPSDVARRSLGLISMATALRETTCELDTSNNLGLG